MRNPEAVKVIAEGCGLITWPSFLARVCDTSAEKYSNGGWRGAKSLGDTLDVFVEIYLNYLLTEGNHLVWLVGATYDQAHEEYNYLRTWAIIYGLQVEASNALMGPRTMTITRAGKPGVVTVQTKSAEDPTSLGSVAPSIILCCEAGQFSEEARDFIRGRTLTRNARIIWSGTFENEKGHAQFAWYEQESAEFWANPTPRRHVYRLPTWENMALYGDCREMIRDDQSLAFYCPDDNHGPEHSGMNHPKLRELYEIYKDQPLLWKKRYGGEPVGVQNPVYEWALANPERFLVPMPAALKGLEPASSRGGLWLRTAGGMDFGTVHPSAITIGSIASNGDTWVRRSLKDSSGAIDWIWATKEVLTRQYAVSSWGADPMVKYNPTFLEAEAMSGSLYAREARVGIVNSVAQKGHLFFDSDDPGVVLLFREMQRVHRRRNSNGQVAYVREEDDMTASFEDMMAMLHGQPFVQLPKTMNLRRRRPVATVTRARL